MTVSRGRAVLAALAASGVLAACSAAGSAEPRATGRTAVDAEQAARFTTTPPAQETTVVPTTDPASAALAASRDLYDTAPVVVLAPADDTSARDRAVGLGAPLLVADGDPRAVTQELERLGARAVLAVGVDEQAHAEHLDAVDAAGAEVVTDPENLPDTDRGPELSDVLVLEEGQAWAAPAVASAQAAGARVRTLPGGDPRTDPEAIAAIAEQPPSHVLALGDAFGPVERLAARVASAATGVQLPGGGQVVFPHRRLVALYGHPGTAALGVLGEQDVDAAVARARQVAAEYEPYSDVPVVPAFEIIATVASSEAGPDGDYSAEADVEALRPWVDAAREAGVYVLLDLQPGTTDFLTQAQRYAELLAEPHVGLALDPEWRLRPGQRHLQQIGSVDVEEVNAVAAWLAELTRSRSLPQKALVLHQFRLSMIAGRERLDTSRDEVAVVIHADGNGTPGEKLATWDALRATPPPGVHWAWKNFYDEDSPTFTPEQTMGLDPAPVLISYQ